MSIHPSPRLPAAAGDAAPAPGADSSGGVGDLFNTLVSGLVGTGTTPSASADDETEQVVPEVTDTPSTATKDVPESVEQLLALVGASRTHAGKKGAPLDAEGKKNESSGDTPPAIQDAPAPAGAPTIVATLAQPAPTPAAPAATTAPEQLAALPAAPTAAVAPALPGTAEADATPAADPSLPD